MMQQPLCHLAELGILHVLLKEVPLNAIELSTASTASKQAVLQYVLRNAVF